MKTIPREMTPPGGWRYPVGGKMIRSYTSWTDFTLQVQQAARIAVLPPPLDAELIDFMCRDLGDLADCCCIDEKGPVWVGDCAKVGPADLARVSVATLQMLATPGGRVTEDVARARAVICKTCPQNVNQNNCTGCGGERFVTFLTRVRGATQIPEEADLHTCCLCGCYLKAKVWYGEAALESSSRSGEMEQIQLKAPHCWRLTANTPTSPSL